MINKKNAEGILSRIVCDIKMSYDDYRGGLINTAKMNHLCASTCHSILIENVPHTSKCYVGLTVIERKVIAEKSHISGDELEEVLNDYENCMS